MRTRLPTSRAFIRIRISTVDSFCAFAAPLLALYLSNALILASKDFSEVTLYCAVSLVFSIVAFLLFRVHDGMSRYFSVHDALDILKAAGFSQLLTTVALFTVTRLDGIPRSTPIYQALILAAGLVTIRAIAQALQNGNSATNDHNHTARENIIMIGATHLSSLYIKLLEAVSPGERRIIALLDNRPQLVGRSMAGIRIFSVHYLWEDCVSMVLGVLIALTSWMVGDAGSQAVVANAAIIGILVLALGASEFLDLRRWEEGLETACGLWLIASPFIFGYADAGTLRYWHFLLGAAVVLLAMLELRQDWNLSRAELSRHSAR